MKIKEVIEQTGLTDRAIRLYISNGLIAPASQRSYTGRNSYDFTEEDVIQLKRIALLRKADFSLEQIRILQQGGEPVREMLEAYFTEKQEQLNRNQKILTALQTMDPEKIPSMEAVCEAILEGFQTEPMPKGDLKPTVKERLETWLVRLLTVPPLFFFGLTLLGMKLDYEEEFLFPKPGKSILNYIGIAYVLLPIVLMVVVLFLYRRPVYTEAKHSARRNAAAVLFLITILSACNPYGTAALMLFPTVYSETDNPSHYLQLGRYERMYADTIYELFPANIPRSAVAEGSSWYPPDKFPDTTQYYYFHANDVDPNFDLYAQWALPDEAFRGEVDRFETGRAAEIQYREQKGEWVCLHFTEFKEENLPNCHSYYFVIFAYNEEINMVRYTVSYAMDTGGTLIPYFLSLDWN